MKKIKELGTCPKCSFSLYIYKTNNYKRFAKCDNCKLSYSLPKRGSISNSALTCPQKGFPLLIVEKSNNEKPYFWSDRPCFTCTKIETCVPRNDLITEFKELEVFGY